ncbi:orotidine-5'-phosphate decarboxylase [Amycolatopsis regifaucium]|uniref:Orotidine 5'-phosphate decarboxylase n=1 Tax=Amycolatopsis regifaucium TaxID=546365 RepID=A0A154M7U2_9PSEU|nr:orotidine-5'-phosphate decarboxylase [Amycolatopsis regifaucium]KZB80698.1 Orotidine 5'-phosphate decarboxylase [Amycolatopsis regifaucium]OKA07762.1 orotidine 5'-phosphate decarboxylase [Amycolatopsis regifaucium]SFH03037.1 orotidine-5'-phosphate decarboxylase [Amycolatopsis regifaucium]
MTERFGARLARAVADKGPLCAGIDPHPGLLQAWDLPADAGGLEKFALTAAEAIAPEVAVIKPQSAFFEAYGPPGVAVLAKTMKVCREAGALVLLDVKRGDIGSTMAAYTAAFLPAGAELEADAITVSPYLGFGSLAPAIDVAQTQGKGLFVLARTSNPEAQGLQNALLPNGKTVAQDIVDTAAAYNAGVGPLGDIGVVVGATIAPGELDLSVLNGPVLAPGFGAQGATVADLRVLFGPGLPGVLPASSRDVLKHGPDHEALRAAVRRTRDSLGPLENGQ